MLHIRKMLLMLLLNSVHTHSFDILCTMDVLSCPTTGLFSDLNYCTMKHLYFVLHKIKINSSLFRFQKFDKGDTGFLMLYRYVDGLSVNEAQFIYGFL